LPDQVGDDDVRLPVFEREVEPACARGEVAANRRLGRAEADKLSGSAALDPD
jgi:hypothetical protein